MINIKRFLPAGLAAIAILGAINLATSADELTTTTSPTPTANTEMRRGPNPAVQAALDANDYDAWVTAESRDGELPDFLKVITKDNFSQFVSMNQLMKDDKKDEAKKIADELGLKFGMGRGPRDPKVNEAAETAIANGDYDAWVTAVGTEGPDAEVAKVITKDTFPKFVEAYNYQKQAMELMKKSRDLMKELGINEGPGFGRGKGHRGGMMGGFRAEPAETQAQTQE